MFKTIALFASVVVACMPVMSHADSTGGPEGKWPKSWPKELEPLRKQASTWVGGQAMNTRHEIPFSNRKTFEAAWPHILSLKSKGASITLMDGNQYYRNSEKSAGVMILPPMKGVTSGSLSVTRIVLMVDGKVVDLNRIPLPRDTPIVDVRFKNNLK